MELSTLYKCFLECGEVTTDTRCCSAGAMFIALKGGNFNGNAFAEAALQQGCRYAVVDEPQYASADNPQIILVDNCLHTLQALANHHRRCLGTKIVGITGTNGKTTTKELIAHVLMQKYRVLYTQGNLNNHIGVPLTLLRLKPEHEVAVVEMGANHPGEIHELVHIVEPDCGLITNVGKAHLEGFGSFEGVIRTKGELYDYLRTKPGTVVFLQNENPYLNEIAHGLSSLRYGSDPDLYVSGQATSCSPFLAFQWTADGVAQEVQTHLIGAYNLDNALASIAVGRYFDVDSRAISEALATYVPQNNRSQFQKTASNQLIIDAYNANPTSMMAALKNFRQMEGEHKMVVLGDMKELGVGSREEHQKIVDYLLDCHFEKVVLVGSEFAAIAHPFNQYGRVEEVVAALQAHPVQGFLMLIKGSNSMKLSQLPAYL